MLSAMNGQEKKPGRISAAAGWIAGTIGATLVFFGSVPPAQAIANLTAWADALGLRLESRGEFCPVDQLCFSSREIGLLEYMVIFGTLLLLFAVWQIGKHVAWAIFHRKGASNA